jgi:hypothetical protein
MLWRSSRGRPLNAPAAFIHPCQPIVAKQPPSGSGWAHELKHDGYRLQIHVRDGRVRLYTITGANWSKRYPLIVRDAGRIEGSAIIDAEVVWLVRRESYQFRSIFANKFGISRAQRTSIRTLRPSDQPNCWSACRKAVLRALTCGSSAAPLWIIPMRLTRSPCCARAANGQTAAEPTIALMKSRRRTH